MQPINLQHQLQLNTASVTSSPTRYRSQVQTQISTSSEVEPPVSFANTPNTLRVPSSGYGGAIPRRTVISRDSSADSTASDAPASSAPSMASHKRTCFCGHYSEVRKRPLNRYILYTMYIPLKIENVVVSTYFMMNYEK